MVDDKANASVYSVIAIRLMCACVPKKKVGRKHYLLIFSDLIDTHRD
jgi:hypothetical protein